MKNIYLVTVTDTVTYAIKAESKEAAEDLAVEWFSEREPDVKTEIDNSETPDITI